MAIRRVAALVVLTAVLLLAGYAGCAGSGPTPTDSPDIPGGSFPVSGGPTWMDVTPFEAPPVLPSEQPAAGGSTVTGTVVAGVEAGCLLLRSGGIEYLLLLGPTAASPGAPKVGDKVTVTGTVDTAKVTTCQQGTPLVVTRIQPG